jgi:multidrug efflux pump subunit AcrB
MAAQTTLEATLGNINTPSVWIDPANGQSYYVVTYYDGAKVGDPSALAQIPVRLNEDGKSVPLGAYGLVRRSVGPIAVERNQLQRAAHIYAQTEGRDIGSAAEDLEKRLKSNPKTHNIDFDFVGQVQLMRTTFSGLGLAIGLAVMVVFMIMAAQFKSLRLPFVMLFTIPVSLVGIVAALMAAGQGFSITALMGILMVVGIAVSNGRCREARRGRRGRTLEVRSHRDDQPRDGHRPHPHRDRAREGNGGQPAARAGRRRRPHLLDDPVALPRPGHVHVLCQAVGREGRAR